MKLSCGSLFFACISSTFWSVRLKTLGLQSPSQQHSFQRRKNLEIHEDLQNINFTQASCLTVAEFFEENENELFIISF